MELEFIEELTAKDHVPQHIQSPQKLVPHYNLREPSCTHAVTKIIPMVDFLYTLKGNGELPDEVAERNVYIFFILGDTVPGN
jgi:hypothetical protein